MSRSVRPTVGIPCCVKQIGLHPFQVVGDKYVKAVSDGADCFPMLLPALGSWYDYDELLDRIDGLLITGSLSHVHPSRYGGPQSEPGTPHDEARDATTLPLIRRALDRGVPLLGICRGFQELNVVLGGTLHPKIHEIPGRLDHRADYSEPVDVQYGPAHDIKLTAGGELQRIFGKSETTVNSIHWQGIDRLAEGLAIEAVAPDGQIEAVSVESAQGFALAVQWHPEWRFWENPDSVALFKAFGRAVRDHAAGRTARAAAE